MARIPHRGRTIENNCKPFDYIDIFQKLQLTSQFAYLFYDIIFLPVPFVFETEFQNAPLDLATDAFYFSRASEINHRLADIQNGYTRDIIMETYEREHERQTECVGLDWRFDIREILEAAEVCVNFIHFCPLLSTIALYLSFSVYWELSFVGIM